MQRLGDPPGRIQRLGEYKCHQAEEGVVPQSEGCRILSCQRI